MDSFLASTALATLRFPPGRWRRLAILFGVCDRLAALVGLHFTAAALLIPLVLAIAWRSEGAGPVALAVLLSLDDLFSASVGSAPSSILLGISSFAFAMVGFSCGALLQLLVSRRFA
jgi:hypothetical protein